jgi:hypothetical protein
MPRTSFDPRQSREPHISHQLLRMRDRLTILEDGLWQALEDARPVPAENADPDDLDDQHVAIDPTILRATLVGVQDTKTDIDAVRAEVQTTPQRVLRGQLRGRRA